MARNYHYTDKQSSAIPISVISTLVAMESAIQTAKGFANNLDRLMKHHGLSQAQLSKKTGIGQSTLSNLLDVKNGLEINPRLSTLQQLGAFFQIPAWLLLVPNVPLELLTSKRLATLLQNYRDLPESGRQNVDRIVAAELRYAELPEPVKQNGTR